MIDRPSAVKYVHPPMATAQASPAVIDVDPDNPHAWLADAACPPYGTAYFYPDQYDYAQTQRALAVCRGCPVAGACLDDALGVPQALDRYGIVGAMTPAGRRKERKRRHAQTPAAEALPAANGDANGHPPQRVTPRSSGQRDWLEAALGR